MGQETFVGREEDRERLRKLVELFKDMPPYDPNRPMTPIQMKMQDGFDLPHVDLPALPPGHPLLKKDPAP